jgi:hypothetical protein
MQTRCPDPAAFLFAEDWPRLRRGLADARERGATFETAWPVALAAADFTIDTRAVAEATRGTWHRAYEGAPPTAGELQLVRLAGDLSRGLTNSDQ